MGPISPGHTPAAHHRSSHVSRARSLMVGICVELPSESRLSIQVLQSASMRQLPSDRVDAQDSKEIIAALKTVFNDLKNQWQAFLPPLENTVANSDLLADASVSEASRKICQVPINFSELRAAIKKILVLLQRFNGLTAENKLLKIEKYKAKILDKIPSSTEEGELNSPISIDTGRYFNAQKAENKIPKAIASIEKLLVNFTQLDEAAKNASNSEDISVGTQKIIQEVVDNIPRILQKHRLIYQTGANSLFGQYYRGAKHLSLTLGARLAMRILKKHIDTIIVNDKTGMSAELRGALLARPSSVAHSATDERLYLYANTLENFRLAKHHLEGSANLTQLMQDFGMVGSVNYTNPVALEASAHELNNLLG